MHYRQNGCAPTLPSFRHLSYSINLEREAVKIKLAINPRIQVKIKLAINPRIHLEIKV